MIFFVCVYFLLLNNLLDDKTRNLLSSELVSDKDQDVKQYLELKIFGQKDTVFLNNESRTLTIIRLNYN